MVSTIALLNAERQKNAVLRKVNTALKNALQEAFRYESSQYNAFLAIKKAQEKNLEKAGLKAT